MTTDKYCGITLATGSHTTTSNWYTLNDPITTSSLIQSIPTIIYAPATATYNQYTISIRSQFTVDPTYDGIFEITHMGLTSRIDDDSYVVW